MTSATTTGFLSTVMLVFVLILVIYSFSIKDNSIEDGSDSPPMICSLGHAGRRPWSSTKYCSPTVNVFFLKTHKCASSTVQNILMRFGDQRNLIFALPESSNYIGHPELFSKNSLPAEYKPPHGFNILCHHLRLNMDEVRSVMPSDAKFISVVRDPSSLFESMYDYYNISSHTGLPLNEFIYNQTAMLKLTTERINQRFGRNQMLFDMGFHHDIWDNDTLIHDAIDKIDQFFDLVMISELFEESVILLKHQLCWSMEDIIYLVHNKRSHSDSSYKLAIKSRIKDYNKADQILYDHFVSKLNKAIDEFGRDRMAQEVNELRLWNAIWQDHCIQKLATSSDSIPEETKAYSSKVYSFILKDGPIANICRNLAIEELQYTQKLRAKQMK